MRHRGVLGFALSLTVAASSHFTIAAQSTPAALPAEFDAASIKENRNLVDGETLRLMPQGTGIVAEHVRTRTLINIAYDLQPFQLVGVPDWVRETQYDLNAKTGQTTTREQLFVMLQALLKDRFKLTFHRENRQLDGFALVRVRPNALGPSLRPTSLDCSKAAANESRCRQARITMSVAGNSANFPGVPMWSLLQLVVSQVGAPVGDETQLSGMFDMDLRWTNEVAPSGDLRSIYTALQEQLGLKLERRKVISEVFVVDHVERPSPD